MAYPSSQLDAAKNPQTRCSNCQTVFEVSRELLSSSDTRVRCGECLSIFDALEELRSAEQIDQDHQPNNPNSHSTFASGSVAASSLAGSKDASLAGLSNDTAALDVTYSDFDLFSEDADLPEIAYFDQTRDTPDFDFDAVEMGNDETFSDTLFVHDVTIDADATTLRGKSLQNEPNSGAEYAEIDFVADAQPREPLIFNYRDAEAPQGKSAEAEPARASAHTAAPVTNTKAVESRTYSSADGVTDSIDESNAANLEAQQRTNPWIFRLGMFMLLGVLLGALFAYRTRPQLYNNPTMRPVLEVGCKIVRCSLPARIDLGSLKMVKRNVYSHPNTPNALVVNVSFRNDAEFAQQLPVLHMVLSNRVGRTVAKKDFTPPEYMPNWTDSAIIESKQQLDVKLEVIDPGRDAQSFEFYFREFKS